MEDTDEWTRIRNQRFILRSGSSPLRYESGTCVLYFTSHIEGLPVTCESRSKHFEQRKYIFVKIEKEHAGFYFCFHSSILDLKGTVS